MLINICAERKEQIISNQKNKNIANMQSYKIYWLYLLILFLKLNYKIYFFRNASMLIEMHVWENNKICLIVNLLDIILR